MFWIDRWRQQRLCPYCSAVYALETTRHTYNGAKLQRHARRAERALGEKARKTDATGRSLHDRAHSSQPCDIAQGRNRVCLTFRQRRAGRIGAKGCHREPASLPPFHGSCSSVTIGIRSSSHDKAGNSCLSSLTVYSSLAMRADQRPHQDSEPDVMRKHGGSRPPSRAMSTLCNCPTLPPALPKARQRIRLQTTPNAARAALQQALPS